MCDLWLSAKPFPEPMLISSQLDPKENKYTLLMPVIKFESPVKFIFQWIISIHLTYDIWNCEL